VCKPVSLSEDKNTVHSFDNLIVCAGSYGGWDENGYFVGYNGLEMHPAVSYNNSVLPPSQITIRFSLFRYIVFAMYPDSVHLDA